MAQDDLARELLDLLLEGVDQKKEAQEDRLKHYSKKHQYAVTLGQDVIHHDRHDMKDSVKQARDNTYSSMKFECLDQMIRNWDNRKVRSRLLKEERDIEVARPLMEGVRGASLVDKKIGKRRSGIDLS